MLSYPNLCRTCVVYAIIYLCKVYLSYTSLYGTLEWLLSACDKASHWNGITTRRLFYYRTVTITNWLFFKLLEKASRRKLYFRNEYTGHLAITPNLTISLFNMRSFFFYKIFFRLKTTLKDLYKSIFVQLRWKLVAHRTSLVLTIYNLNSWIWN